MATTPPHVFLILDLQLGFRAPAPKKIISQVLTRQQATTRSPPARRTPIVAKRRDCLNPGTHAQRAREVTGDDETLARLGRDRDGGRIVRKRS
jgi:hypothetical protein